MIQILSITDWGWWLNHIVPWTDTISYDFSFQEDIENGKEGGDPW